MICGSRNGDDGLDGIATLPPASPLTTTARPCSSPARVPACFDCLTIALDPSVAAAPTSRRCGAEACRMPDNDIGAMVGSVGGRTAAAMSALRLTYGGYVYLDRTRALQTGQVQPKGVELNVQVVEISELF